MFRREHGGGFLECGLDLLPSTATVGKSDGGLAVGGLPGLHPHP